MIRDQLLSIYQFQSFSIVIKSYFIQRAILNIQSHAR
jgi:hypothetical protein